MNEPDELTVVVHRRIKAGREAEFESAMREFVQFALGFPGYRGIDILRPVAGGRDYIVVGRHTDESARRRLKESSDYRAWMDRLAEFTEGAARIEEITGLEGWFDRPGEPAHAKPPKYKMAAATFLGVFPVALLLNLTIAPFMRSWHAAAAGAVFSACVVALLTWVVMPLITRLLQPWLFPPGVAHARK